MKQQRSNNLWGMVALALVFVVLGVSFVYFVSAASPGGPQITYVSNSSRDTSTGTNRSTDNEGMIHTINLNMQQQNSNWKAYVGNVTGGLVLDDAAGYSIYDWTLTSIAGEVYASRASSVTWGSSVCVNSSSQVLIDEQTWLGMSGTEIDNINYTYNYTNHPSMTIGTTTLSNSTCKSTFTYIDDAHQDTAQDNNFTAVLIQDGTNLVYATFISDNMDGYKNNDDTYDFQLIIPENRSTADPTQYYFFVELTS